MSDSHGKYWHFYYNYDREQLMQYMLLPAKEKLQWLKEYLDFLEEAMTPEAKEIWMKFRSGELKYPIE